MNKQSIHQQIDSLLKLLATQHETMKESKQPIPQMEMDIMLQNLRQLYEAALMLNHTNALSSLDEVKAAVTQKILAEKRMIELKTAGHKEEEKHDDRIEKIEAMLSESLKEEDKAGSPAKKEDIHLMDEVIAKTISSEHSVLEEKKEKSIKTKKISTGINTLFEDAPTLGDKYEDGESLHEHIAPKAANKSVTHNQQHKPIRDLKAAIGINEKFLLINQLFDGNLQDYTNAIEKLNSSPDLESAKKYIVTELVPKFNWDDDNHHVKNFLDLVERRFIA